MKNRYKKVAHFSENKFRQAIKCFSLDLTASDTAHMCGLSRNTINTLFNQICKRIFLLAQRDAGKEKSLGVFECDESYFGAILIRGKRGRGAAGKTSVFGLLKRDGRVYVQIVEEFALKANSCLSSKIRCLRALASILTDGKHIMY